MKKLIIALSLLMFAGSTYAAETIGEKTDATVNEAKRAVKSTSNRVGEKVCDKKTGKNCVAKKIKNKAKEAKDYTKDKAKEGTNIIDNDKK